MRRMRKHAAGSDINMTPMIDVVFQLIIFFIVTVKLEKEINKEIELAMAEHGPILKTEDPRTAVIEVDRKGWITLRGTPVTKTKLKIMMYNRAKRFGGDFPVLIRADKRTRHVDVRGIMDMCTELGIWKIQFAAIQEKKT